MAPNEAVLVLNNIFNLSSGLALYVLAKNILSKVDKKVAELPRVSRRGLEMPRLSVEASGNG